MPFSETWGLSADVMILVPLFYAEVLQRIPEKYVIFKTTIFENLRSRKSEIVEQMVPNL